MHILQYTSLAMRSTPLQSQQSLCLVERYPAHANNLSPRSGSADEKHVAWSYPQKAGDETCERRIGAPFVWRRLEPHAEPSFDDAEQLIALGSRTDPEREIDAILSRAQRPVLTT